MERIRYELGMELGERAMAVVNALEDEILEFYLTLADEFENVSYGTLNDYFEFEVPQYYKEDFKEDLF